MTKKESGAATRLKGISKERQTGIEKKEKWVGQNLPRHEAYRFTQGKGEYSGDVRLADSLYLCATGANTRTRASSRLTPHARWRYLVACFKTKTRTSGDATTTSFFCVSCPCLPLKRRKV